MSNDTSTLSGALLEMKDQLIYELGQKGVTASYDSSTGLLGLIGRISDIQTGGSCYHIGFSEDSYVAVGGSATLEVYLQSNYAPLSGATVTVTGSDSSLYTGITDSTGKATVTVSVSANTTFAATYSNVSDTCSVVVQTILYFDAMDDSTTLTNYTKQNGSANLYMEHTGDDHFYIRLSGTGIALWTINNLTVPNKVKISCDWLMGGNSTIQPKLLIYDPSISDGYAAKIYRYNSKVNINNHTLTSEGTSLVEDSLSLSSGTWYTVEFIVNQSSLTYNVYDANDTLLKSISATGSLNLSANSNVVGFALANTSGADAYIRNLKVEAL